MASSQGPFLSYNPFSYTPGLFSLPASNPVQAPMRPLDPAASKVDEVAKEAISPEVANLVRALPQDTLMQLHETRQAILSELDVMLNNDDGDVDARMDRYGTWDRAQELFNDLLLINRQINLLVRAKGQGTLRREEQQAVGKDQSRLKVAAQTALFQEKLLRLSDQFQRPFEKNPSDLADEEIVKLLETVDWTTVLSNYRTNLVTHASVYTLVALTAYMLAQSKVLSTAADQVNPFFGLCVRVPEMILSYSSSALVFTPLAASYTALTPTAKANLERAITAPARYLSNEVSNLKDAATDIAQFGIDSGTCITAYTTQTAKIALAVGVGSGVAGFVANTGVVSTVVGAFAPEAGYIVGCVESGVSAVSGELGWKTALAGSALASATVIDNPKIKKPSTKQMCYTVPKAANFIRNAAFATTVATAALAGALYAPTLLLQSAESPITNLAIQGAFEIGRRTALIGGTILGAQYAASAFSATKDYMASFISKGE